MRILIVYDHTLDVNRISVPFQKGDELFVFPLTSVTELTDYWRRFADEKGCTLTISETARLMNFSANKLRGKYIDFIADLGLNFKVEGKNLREWFAIDDVASMWWLSLVAEKNTFKTDTFNKLIQLDALVSAVKQNGIQKIYFGCVSEKLQQSLKKYAKAKNVPCYSLASHGLKNLKKNLKEFQHFYLLRHVGHLALVVVSFAIKSFKVRKKLKPLSRAPHQQNQLILASGFPYFDMSAAKKGILRNKLYAHLQDVLETKQKNVLWVMFFIKSNDLSFDEALSHAVDFIKKGYSIYFLEEARTLKMQIRSLLMLFKQALGFLKIQRELAKAHVFDDYNFYSIFKDDWYQSFCGSEGYQCLLFYEMFKIFFADAVGEKCLHCCEMQSWEKTLAMAKKKMGSTIPVLAYQHTTVSKMLMNYFNSPVEINTNGRYSLAQPDKIICNGSIPYNYFKESSWPENRLSIAEAVRFNDLKKYFKVTCQDKKKVVLLASSIGAEEVSALLAQLVEALKGKNDIEVWIKLHPLIHAEKILGLSEIIKEKSCFKIKTDPIEYLLVQARIVVVGESSVSLQALLFGCDVVLVNVPEFINMSPLLGFNSSKVHTVNSSQELKEKIIDVFQGPASGSVLPETRKIVDEFFYLNQDSDVPDKFLKLLGV